MGNALEQIQAKIIKDVSEGTLLVVTVGNESAPATKGDMEKVSEKLKEVLEDIKGVRVLVVPHLIKIDNIPLKTLRNIESQIISSWEDHENPIIDGITIDGLLGDD